MIMHISKCQPSCICKKMGKNLTFTFTGHALLLGGYRVTGHVFTKSTQEKEMPNQTEVWM